MKKILTYFIAISVFLGTYSVSAKTNVFKDVPQNHWAYQSIEKAYQDGLVKGTHQDKQSGESYFSPNKVLTVAEFLTILGRGLYPEMMERYQDGTKAWYYPAETLAKEYDLLEDVVVSDIATQQINRYDMATIIYNILHQFGTELPKEEEIKAKDLKIGDYETIKAGKNRKQVETVFYYGILTGLDEAGTFGGEKKTTRAQATLIYYKMSKLLHNMAGWGAGNQEFNADLIPAGLGQSDKNVEAQKESDKEQESSKETAYKQETVKSEPKNLPVKAPLVLSKTDKFRQEVLHLVNIERQKVGLHALTYDAGLEEASQVRAVEIVQSFSHTRPNGSSPFTALKEAGVQYRYAGENLAAGHLDAKEVVEAWMRSEGHRKNILSKRYTAMGLGYMEAKSGYKYYWAQMFAELK